MRITDIIENKKQGKALSQEEIEFFIAGYVEGDIPDYQISSLLMAIWFQGMNSRETTDLTLTMTRSGDQIDLSSIPGVKADKHSTGGVADTTTLITVPLVAACGGKVAKMSGRGLGHSGGTLDKLESIPGFQVFQPMERFIEIVNTHGLSVVGQTANLVPADKKLYSLRDVTGTVDNVSLIAGSIMSKKIAAGSDVIVLDVKVGSGAFIKSREEAVRLAEMMVSIGNRAERKTVALVTDMDQPLGNEIGNALEVREAIEVLRGDREGDLKTVAVELAAEMLVLSGLASDREAGKALCRRALGSGKGLEKLAAMIEAQGGDPEVTENVGLLPRAARTLPVTSDRSGWVGQMDAQAIGEAAMLLGAGRLTKDDSIDHAVGITMKKRIGDRVEKGDELAVFHVNKENELERAVEVLKDAVHIREQQAAPPPLIHSLIE